MKNLHIFLLSLLFIILMGCQRVAETAVSPTPTPTATPIPEYATIPGAYLGRFHGASGSSVKLEEEIGKGIAIQLNYIDWNTGFNPGFYRSANAVNRIGYTTWEYQQGPATDLQAIIDGEHDEYIQTWAEGIAGMDLPMFLRWGHEMNGDWYRWSGSQNGGGQLDGFGDPIVPDGPERFVAAYRHIYDIFQAAGAENVLWVWCPNAPFAVMETSYGSTLGGWNSAKNYYPGDDYVDWICFDGYNFGTSAFGQQFNSQWLTFDDIYADSYAQLQAINPSKPIMIGEYASTEEGGDKAAWILDAYDKIQQDYPQIRAVVWFHIAKETDWRINSSPESLDAFATAVSDTYWLDEWPDE